MATRRFVVWVLVGNEGDGAVDDQVQPSLFQGGSWMWLVHS